MINITKTILFASLIAITVIGAVMIPLSIEADSDKKFNDQKERAINNLDAHKQPHMEKILDLERERHFETNEAKKIQIDNEINNALKQLEQANKKYQDEKPKVPQVIKDRREAASNTIQDDLTIPWFLVTPDHNKLVILLHTGNENQGWEEYIDNLLPNNVRYEITYSGGMELWSCDSIDDDCDPLYGGLEVRKGSSSDAFCTLGLPVKQGSTYGYLSAGHCYQVGNTVYQPYSSYKIGKVQSGDSMDDSYGDMSFITKDNNRGQYSAVWLSSYSTAPIRGNYLPSVGSDVDITGAKGGSYDEEVVSKNANLRNSQGVYTDYGVILLKNTGFGGPGDSGAPVYDYSDRKIVGILNGASVDGNYLFVTPWSKIADSTNGLGVSLIS